MTTAAAPSNLFARCLELARDIKIAHSLFALPFALLAAFCAAEGGVPEPGKIVLIVAAMVTARTVAMTANRVIDARLDSINPRTRRRALPAGRLSARFVLAWLAGSALGFVVVCALFGVIYGNWLPVVFAVPVLVAVCVYPYLKRFTNLCHYYLGLALALAPVCTWVAIDGSAPLAAWVLGLGVLLWTAGFDILYATADYDVDRAVGTHSVPVTFGIRGALWVSRLTHVGALTAFALATLLTPALGLIWLAAVGVCGLLLVAEHAMVRPKDLSKLNVAFFTMNAVIALLLGAAGVVDAIVSPAV